MQILNNNELIDIYGGAKLMITPLYGIIKIVNWISKLIKPKF